MGNSLTIIEFSRLSKSEQYSLLEDYGSFLEAFYIEGPHKVALFELNGFYVEVWLNQKTDKLLKAVAFDDYNKLDLFLKEVDITSIYSAL